VSAAAVPAPAEADTAEPITDAVEPITDAAKLLRLADMAEALLAEVRATRELDPPGRRLLAASIERALVEIGSVLSDELLGELSRLVVPLRSPAPSEGEVRVAEAQLVGWLEGLLAGLQMVVPAPVPEQRPG
jgi:hypothetical protein